METKVLLGAATAVALTLSLSSGAQAAGVLASAVLQIENFQLSQDSTGTTPFASTSNGGTINPTSVSNTADLSADLDSVPGTATATQGATSGPVDLGQVCQGPGCSPVGENVFTGLEKPVTGTYALADQKLDGTAIDFGGGAGANARTRADSGLQVTDNGSSNANTGLDSSFNFTSLVNDEMFITFDFIVDVYAYVQNDPAMALGFAQARSSWSMTFTDETAGTTQTFAPGVLNQTVSRNQANAKLNEEQTNATQTGSICIDTDTNTAGCQGFSLIAGHDYTVSITHQVFADTDLKVPEPATLGMFGVGLLALAGLFRLNRKRNPLAM